LKDIVYFVLDGDMNEHYEFDESSLTVEQMKDVEYLQNCVKQAFGTTVEAITDSGGEEQKNSQKCDILLQYLRAYNSNVFFLPGDMIPEEIALSSNYAKENYGDILSKYDVIDSSNAKKIVREISESEHGDTNHISDTISKLFYKWTQEESDLKAELIDVLETIFNK